MLIYIDVTKFCVFLLYTDMDKTYTHLYNGHNRGKIGGKSGKQCTIDGVTYNTKQEAYKKLGRRYVDRYLNH